MGILEPDEREKNLPVWSQGLIKNLRKLVDSQVRHGAYLAGLNDERDTVIRDLQSATGPEGANVFLDRTDPGTGEGIEPLGLAVGQVWFKLPGAADDRVYVSVNGNHLEVTAFSTVGVIPVDSNALKIITLP
jgi:hypothetical protein